jgi:hypothetical protein
MGVTETIANQRRMRESLFPPAKRVKRTGLTRGQRLAAQAETISQLEACLIDVRRKARETPGWAAGLNAAATTIELQIAKIKGT